MKKIAIIASITEFKAFRSFLKLVDGIEFIRIDAAHQLAGLELIGFIDTGTVKNAFTEIVPFAKSRIR